MIESVNMIVDFFSNIIGIFDSHPLQVGPYEVSWFSLIFAGLVVAMVAAYFWKGARA